MVREAAVVLARSTLSMTRWQRRLAVVREAGVKMLQVEAAAASETAAPPEAARAAAMVAAMAIAMVAARAAAMVAAAVQACK